jgi:predicted secreted hydrolase
MTARPLVLYALCGLALAGQVTAQGFAGLGRAVDGFSLPQRGYTFTFPDDHGAHPDFQIEWWYVTANLTDAAGRDLGLQWTLFRSAMAPEDREGWQSPQLWLAHAAVTTPEAHFVTERRARGGIGQAGVRTAPFEAWIDDWSLAGDTLDEVRMRATGPDFGYDVSLTAEGPLIFHGENGYSQKSQSGRASYYYSQPFYRVTGTLMLPEGAVEVTGTAWLDREWASQPLAATQVSWDWFSMVFEGGARLMGFTLHDSDGGDYAQATWIDPDGTTTAYPDGAFSAKPLATTTVAGRDVPTTWRARLPERGVDVTVSAINGSAWMETSIPYWEGPVRISGSHAGRGYLEMTGY